MMNNRTVLSQILPDFNSLKKTPCKRLSMLIISSFVRQTKWCRRQNDAEDNEPQRRRLFLCQP